MSATVDRRRERVIESVLRGPGRATHEARGAAYDNAGVDPRARALVEKVARHAWTVTDADVAAAKATGLSDDEIFELSVSAALGQATRQRTSAMAALQAAMAQGDTE